MNHLIPSVSRVSKRKPPDCAADGADEETRVVTTSAAIKTTILAFNRPPDCSQQTAPLPSFLPRTPVRRLFCPIPGRVSTDEAYVWVGKPPADGRHIWHGWRRRWPLIRNKPKPAPRSSRSCDMSGATTPCARCRRRLCGPVSTGVIRSSCCPPAAASPSATRAFAAAIRVRRTQFMPIAQLQRPGPVRMQGLRTAAAHCGSAGARG